MPDFSYRCRDCDSFFTVSYADRETMLDAEPRCPVDPSHHVNRQVPALSASEATACLNAKSKADSMYPREDFAISRKTPGIHRFTKRGIPIIESKEHERTIIGMSNGMLARD